MVSLYIENRYIELDKEVQFAITKTFEDITNPTSIINDWSKTVSIPFTDSNNETFGHIYNPDRITLHDEDLSTGLYFDPLKKLDFRLEWDSAVLMTGYAKMTSVTKTNGTGRYNITLNGELGKVFQEMKKITFDETKYVGEDKDKYWIDGSNYVDSIMNINSFINSDSDSLGFWQSEPMYSEQPEKNKCINFTLNNGFSKGFDYTTFEKNNDDVHTIKKFTEVLSNVNFATETGIEPDDVIKDGLKPREIGEYRTYLQHPFIYLHQLFYIFKDKFESISDYKIDFDISWFNKYNPYWAKLIFMLKNLNITNDSQQKSNNYYNTELTNNSSKVWQSGTHNDITITTQPNTLISYTVKLLNDSEEASQIVDWTKNPPLFQLSKLISFYTTYNLQLRFHTRLRKVGKGYKKTTTSINTNQGLNLNLYFRFFKFVNGVKTLINTKTTEYFVCSEIYNDTLPNKTIIYTGLSDYIDGSNEKEQRIVIPVPITASLNESNIIDPDTFVEIDFDANWLTNDSIFQLADLIFVDSSDTAEEIKTFANVYLEAADNNDNLIANVVNESQRTGRQYSLNDIWENKNELFSEIIRYCKIFRINIIVDEYNKTIKFIQSKDYFRNLTIEDWTNKIDKSKSIDIVPITFENKYILFNYENDDSVLNKEYNTKSGLNYGEYKLTTDYNFNIETKNLFEGVKTSINYTPNIISWSNLYENKKIIYSFPNEIYLYDYDKDEVDLFGRYFFYNQLINFDKNEVLKLRDVFISDDTEYQTTNNKYCYTQDSDITKRIKIDKFPLCTVVEGDNCCLFNIPIENYTFNSSLFRDKKSIYYNIWQNYLDERYNTNNKIVTCYLDISPADYINFEFNKFIKIENQLYMVNKIYDYDITTNSTTKVDLITIQDIEGYTNINFTIDDYFEVFYNKGELFEPDYHYIDLYKEDNKHTIYISSSSDVYWAITTVNYGDYDKVTINGVSGETGTIKSGIEVPVTFVNNYGNSSFEVTFTNEQGESMIITVVATAANSLLVTKSNGVEAFDYETIYINTSSEQSTTLYVTSDTPVNVSIIDITKGALEDITINGVNGDELWRGIREVELSEGSNIPLIISGLSGANFSIDIELNNYKQIKTFTIVSIW